MISFFAALSLSSEQDLTNANQQEKNNGKPGQNILPEKRGARSDAFVPVNRQPSNYHHHSNIMVDQRNPEEDARELQLRPRVMHRTVSQNDHPVMESNPSSYQFGPSDNIDERDAEDPLCATEYVQDMYHHFRGKEAMTSVRPLYMENQPHINERMRSILVDWLVEVHLKFKLVPETLYLTINLIDRYLERQEVSRPRLQLVGVTSLLIASKYEEIYPPELRDLVYICDRAYTRGEVRIHTRNRSANESKRSCSLTQLFHLLYFSPDYFDGREDLEDSRVQHHHPLRPCILGSLPESRSCRQAHRPAFVLHFGWHPPKLQSASLPPKSACSRSGLRCSAHCRPKLLESDTFEVC